MPLPGALVALIEATHVFSAGVSYPVRLVSVQPAPPPPHEPHTLMITVETRHRGAVYRAECVVAASDISDYRRVVERIAGCVGAALGQPGRSNYGA